MLNDKTAPCSDVSKCIRIAEAAQVLGYEEKTVYQLCYRKQIPHIKCRGKLFFEKEVIIGWLRNQAERVGYES
jgi:excisionase family DNA binding protein